MRMSRIRQRRLLLQQRRQASHNRQKAAAAVLGSLAVSVPQQSNAALNVLQDINNDFDYMQDSLESINAYDAAKDWVVDAVNNVALAQQYLDEAIQTCRDAEENLLQAQDNQQQAEEDRKKRCYTFSKFPFILCQKTYLRITTFIITHAS